MGEQDRDGLFGGRTCERSIDVVAPELETHGTNCGSRSDICYAGYLNVEGAEGKVGRLGRRRDESEEGMGWGVEISRLSK